MAENRIVENHCIGIQISESFIELSAALNDTDFTQTPQKPSTSKKLNLIKNKRYFIPKDGIKNSISNFINEISIPENTKVQVSLEYLKKALPLKLGGSVAQLVTKGFETWLPIRNHNQEKSPLSNEELIFPINERVSATGEVLVPINEQELQELITQLKTKEVKRVAINFLHANKNSTNTSTCSQVLKENGFEVFTCDQYQSDDEIIIWRGNVLNASLYGLFQELTEEIKTSLATKISPENIQISGSTPVDSMLASTRTRAHFLKNTNTSSGVYLGLEEFSIVFANPTSNLWESPWGKMNFLVPNSQKLSVQPLSPVETNFFNELDFNSNQISFIPGPVCLGRGNQPTLIDIWANEIQEIQVENLSCKINPDNYKKIESQIMAIYKSTHNMIKTPNELIETLKEITINKIAINLIKNECTETTLFGPLAMIFYPRLKKLLPNLKLSHSAFVESQTLMELH